MTRRKARRQEGLQNLRQGLRRLRAKWSSQPGRAQRKNPPSSAGRRPSPGGTGPGSGDPGGGGGPGWAAAARRRSAQRHR